MPNNQTLNDNADLTGRERTRQALLSLLPKNSIGAEIGVSAGVFSKQIVDIVEPKELVLMDPWDLLAERLAGTSDAGKWFADPEKMGAFHADVVAMFKDTESVSVVRGFSHERMGDYGDNYFDWVYLDAHHRYDDVFQELELAGQKVKPGGLITGDDLEKKHRGKSEVAMAVTDWLAKYGQSTDLVRLDRDALPQSISGPSRLGQQFILPVTEAMK